MKQNIKKDIGCFTAGFRDKKVIVGGKAFPAGHLFMNSLNEYWKEAPDGVYSETNKDWLIASRLISTHLHMWNVQDSVAIGCLNEQKAAQLLTDIRYILRVISKAKPFRYLNLQEEIDRCDALFGMESVRRINHFLKERAKNTLQNDEYLISSDTSIIKHFTTEEAHFNNYLATLDYYYKIGDDMRAAYDFGTRFAKQITALEKRDESHLIVLAMECMKQSSFNSQNTPQTEFIAMPKKPNSKNYIVGKHITFLRFSDFLVADFFEGIHVGHYPLLCENCKRYYLKTNAHPQKYCTLIDPNDSQKRTCQEVAAAKGRKAKERHPYKYLYENRLKTIRTHVKRGRITEDEAATAARIAKDCVDKAIYDNVYGNTLYKDDITQDSIYKAAGIKLK